MRATTRPYVTLVRQFSDEEVQALVDGLGVEGEGATVTVDYRVAVDRFITAFDGGVTPRSVARRVGGYFRSRPGVGDDMRVGRPPVARRTTLALLLGALVLLSGCVADDGGEDPEQDVPANVDVVASVDLAALEDDTTRSVLNTLLAESATPGSDDPRTVEELLDRAREEADANVSVDGLNEVAVFARTPDTVFAGEVDSQESYAGVLAGASWDHEDVVGDLRSDADEFAVDGEYRNVTVYRAIDETVDGPERTYFAEYDDGLWAFSRTREVVEDVIDVADGEAPAFGGELRAAYDRTREDAYVRYAVRFSESQRRVIATAAQRAGGGRIDLAALGDVSVYAGAYYTERDRVGVSTYLLAEERDAADRLNDTLGLLIDAGEEFAPDDATRQQFEALSTDRDNRTVAVVYETDADDLERLIEEAGEDAAGTPVSVEARVAASLVPPSSLLVRSHPG